MDEVDVYEAYRPEDPDCPLVRINMVASLDGHIVDAGGVSGTLGGTGDQQAFFAMRHHADAIVAGAGTVIAEGYGPMKLREEWTARRQAGGRDGPAAIVIVTRSLNLDPGAAIVAQAVTPTIILTTTDAPTDKVAAVRDAGAVVVQSGTGDVDLVTGFDALRADHGLDHLLVEGGPDLNGQLINEGLADEICVTLAPVLAGGRDDKRLVSSLGDTHGLQLAKVIEHNGELLLTYRF